MGVAEHLVGNLTLALGALRIGLALGGAGRQSISDRLADASCE